MLTSSHFVSYAMSHLYCQCQKHKYFGCIGIRYRRGSIMNSVYVVVVVPIILHHQQSDDFCKIQKKNAKWTGVVIYVARFIVLLSSGTPCMCMLHCSKGKRGVSIVGLLPLESVHLAHSQRLPLRQRHWTKLKCWTHNYWLFSGKVEDVTPLAHLPKPHQLYWRRLILKLTTISFKKQFRYFAGL
jgi:hypothetical protein